MTHPEYEWQDGAFDAYSWHDNRIRAIRFHSPLEGYEHDVILEIDHITQWIQEGDQFRFAVAPALLVFHQVNDLAINFTLSYKQDLTINYITRRDPATVTPDRGNQWYQWSICCHGFAATQHIDFTSPGFDLKLQAAPTIQSLQRLEDAGNVY